MHAQQNIGYSCNYVLLNYFIRPSVGLSWRAMANTPSAMHVEGVCFRNISGTLHFHATIQSVNIFIESYTCRSMQRSGEIQCSIGICVVQWDVFYFAWWVQHARPQVYRSSDEVRHHFHRMENAEMKSIIIRTAPKPCDLCICQQVCLGSSAQFCFHNQPAAAAGSGRYSSKRSSLFWFIKR